MPSPQEENFQTLAESVARNGGIVLSLPSSGVVRNCKGRFLNECPEGIWLEAEPEAVPLIKELLDITHPMAVSFKGGVIRLSFVTTAVRFDPEFRINSQAVVPAVLVQRPTEIKELQRRSAYRVHVYPGCGLTVKAWNIAEHAVVRDRPLASAELKINVRNISVGGLSVRLPPAAVDARPPMDDQRLRVQLIYQDLDVILEGRLRRPSSPADPAAAGIVFKKLEGDVEGRQKLAALTRIVGELQLEEVQRMRVGLAS